MEVGFVGVILGITGFGDVGFNVNDFVGLGGDGFVDVAVRGGDFVGIWPLVEMVLSI